MDPFTDLLKRLGLSLADMTAFLTRVRQSPIWTGRILEVQLPAGAVSVDVPHGLARPQRGAFVVGQDLAVPLYVLDTPHPVRLTLFVETSQAVAARFRLWVF
jgi:hypothetical protein